MENFSKKTNFTSLCGEIKRLLTIDEVIKYYVNIKKKGKYYVCCCPFHKERTPSFFLNHSLGFYKCFGCGETGDIFSFVEKYENVSFLETVQIFSERYPVVSSFCLELLSLKSESVEVFEKRKKAYMTLNKVQKFFVTSLLGEGSSEAWMFLKKRGLEEGMVRSFGIGFCNDKFPVFLKEDLSKEEFAILHELGLVCSKPFQNQKIVIPFEGRISFPFFDSLGNVVGFSWRFLSSQNEKRCLPRYMNSSESFLFKKREVLFGFFQAKTVIKETRKCFLVEGFFDVVALVCTGVRNTVGVSGTALSPEQCALLKRVADCVCIFFDNDEAGEKATVRAIEKCLEEGFMVNVVRIKGKEKDPDEFLRGKQPNEAEKQIKSLEEDFVSFLFRVFFVENEGLRGKTYAVNKVKSFLSLIKDPVYKVLAFKKLSSLCGVSLLNLQKGCSTGLYKKEEKEKKSTIEEYEEEVLFLLFKILFFWNDEYTEEFKSVLDAIGDGSFLSDEKKLILFSFFNSFKKEGKIGIEVFDNIQDDPLKKRIIGAFFEEENVKESAGGSKLGLKQEGSFKTNSASLFKLLLENILFLKLKKIQAVIANMEERLKECGGGETNKVLDEIEKLKNEEKKISKELKINIF